MHGLNNDFYVKIVVIILSVIAKLPFTPLFTTIHTQNGYKFQKYVTIFEINEMKCDEENGSFLIQIKTEGGDDLLVNANIIRQYIKKT